MIGGPDRRLDCRHSRASDIAHVLDSGSYKVVKETARVAPHQRRYVDPARHYEKADSDLDPIRDHPRYKAMIAAADARLAGKGA